MKYILTYVLILVAFVGISQSDVTKKEEENNQKEVMRFIEKNEGEGDAKIRLEGKEGDPLFIWNGDEVSKSMLSLIGPEDIESVSVVKSGEEVDIYGEKAKNGVVFIQTKPYKNESVAYIYKGELLYDFTYDQIAEERADISMVDPATLKKYLDIEIADHIRSVQVINSPELVQKLTVRSAKDDEEMWDQVWENNKSIERNKRKLAKEAQRKKRKALRKARKARNQSGKTN